MKRRPGLVTAAEANRRFSELLRRVREGQSVIVTSHGRPIARMTPVRTDAVAARARHILLARLRREKVVTIGRWTRDELYGAEE